MLEFLFGWIYKPQIELSFLDSVVAFVEVMGIIILFSIIAVYIEERRKKKEDKDGRE